MQLRDLAGFADTGVLVYKDAAKSNNLKVGQQLPMRFSKSLLRRREGASGRRYWMLETIREHAAEHLARPGERESLEASQADLYVDLAEQAWRQLTTPAA